MDLKFRAPHPTDIYQYFRIAWKGEKLIQISRPSRIGHLCLEIDSLLKETILSGGNTQLYILPDVGDKFANTHIIKYFAKYIRIKDQHSPLRFIRRWGDPMSVVLPTESYAVALEQTARAFAVNAAWAKREPLFRLSDEDRDFLMKYLQRHGFGANDWFVCLHARGAGYSPRDEHLHAFRNVDVESFGKAVETITARGGWCVRIGDPTMPPYRPSPRVIDYATGPDKSSRLDVALLAGCRFLIGSSSGPSNVAHMFGRPSVVTNGAPASASYSVGPKDICLPQRAFDRLGREIHFSEILADSRSNLRETQKLLDAGVIHIPNTPEEIEEAVKEMLDRLEGVVTYTDDDFARQAKFRSFFRRGHYSFGSAASIGRDFLRRYLQ